MKDYLNRLLCEAAPDDGPAQRRLEKAITNGKLRMAEHYETDLARCRNWLRIKADKQRQQNLAA